MNTRTAGATAEDGAEKPAASSEASAPPPDRLRAASAIPPTIGWVRASLLGFVWVTLALGVFNVFVAETFVLRTSSMEPSALGRLSGGERVAAFTWNAIARDPERFEPVLFRYPNNQAISYFKRVVGIGPEQLLLRAGDAWRAGPDETGTFEEASRAGRLQLLVKPWARQLGIFERGLIFDDRNGQATVQPLRSRFSGGQAPPEAAGASWRIRSRRGAPAALDWTGLPLDDRLLDRGAAVDAGGQRPARQSGREAVRDLCIVWRQKIRSAAPNARLSLSIFDPWTGREVRAELDLNAGQARLMCGERELTSGPIATNGRLTLAHWDGQLRLMDEQGGLLEATATPHTPKPQAAMDATQLSFVWEGDAEQELRLISVARDLHWGARGQRRFLVPAEHYAALGDNSGASADSRHWEASAIRRRSDGRVLRGDATGITLERLANPGRNPWREPDGSWIFCDHVGRHHRFESAAEFRTLGTWPSPYFRRSDVLATGALVLGRDSGPRLLR